MSEICEGWMLLHKWVMASDERSVRLRTIHDALYVSLYDEAGGHCLVNDKAITQLQLRQSPESLRLTVQEGIKELMDAKNPTGGQ